MDKSAGMINLARRRLGAEADLHVADLGCPLPFPDEAYDDVTASLVLHNLEDWSAPLAELQRVLKPGGRLIASVNHPFAIYLAHRQAGRDPNYFATYGYTEEWTVAVKPRYPSRAVSGRPRGPLTFLVLAVFRPAGNLITAAKLTRRSSPSITWQIRVASPGR